MNLWVDCVLIWWVLIQFKRKRLQFLNNSVQYTTSTLQYTGVMMLKYIYIFKLCFKYHMSKAFSSTVESDYCVQVIHQLYVIHSNLLLKSSNESVPHCTPHQPNPTLVVLLWRVFFQLFRPVLNTTVGHAGIGGTLWTCWAAISLSCATRRAWTTNNPLLRPAWGRDWVHCSLRCIALLSFLFIKALCTLKGSLMVTRLHS